MIYENVINDPDSGKTLKNFFCCNHHFGFSCHKGKPFGEKNIINSCLKDASNKIKNINYPGIKYKENPEVDTVK